MAKKPEAANPFDFSKMMFDFDPAKFTEEMIKSFSAPSMSLPSIDMQKIMESQRKNVEALTAANQLAAEGMQAIYKRQMEILQQSMDEVRDVADTMKDTKDPRDAAAKQAELAKTAYEKALSNMRELAEMTTKANAEASDAINARIAESLEEVRELAVKLKG